MAFKERENGMNTSSRKNLFILSFTLLVVMLGYSMAMPLLPFYIENFGVGGTELGWLMSSYSLMQLICAPIWGILSDRYGRKPILAIGVIGYTVALFLFGLAQSFVMLFLARSLSGILSSATMPTAMAYIGENTEEKEKSKGMGQLGAMIGFGVILGPLMGGWLSTNSLSLPFFIGLAFIAVLLVIFLLPESRVSQTDTEKQASPTRNMYRRVIFSPVGILLLLIFIMSLGMSNFQGMIGLYAVDKFSLDTTQAGTIWMVMGIVMIVSQGVLVGPLTERLGERRLIKIGLFGGAIGFVLVAISIDYFTSLLALGFFVLTLALTGPALNSQISNFAGGHQGTVMGLNSASTSLGRVIGPLWGGYLYDINMRYPFFSGAATLLLGLMLSIIGLRQQAAGNLVPAPE
jgi:DHA1 family multidrug resistance protein-like MFS transporter